jgi:hypothetical protein
MASRIPPGPCAAPRVPDQRNAVEQFAGFLGRKHGGLASSHHVFRATHGMSGIYLDDVPDHQPVEQHTQRGQMLFDRGCR